MENFLNHRILDAEVFFRIKNEQFFRSFKKLKFGQGGTAITRGVALKTHQILYFLFYKKGNGEA